MSFKPTAHPVLELPSLEVAMQLGAEGFRAAMMRREGIIRAEAENPFGKGWEPSIWKVCDALMGYPWVDKEWAQRMREHLGFERPVQVLLANGGNRAGKSERASKRVMRVLRLRERGRAWALHSKAQMSVDYQQPLFWKYLDPALRVKEIRSQTTYISYKQKTGFTDGKFVLPNRSDCTFLNYEMAVETIEGGNLDIIWDDELVPSNWIDTQELRIAEKNGWLEVTFTPVNGYSATVQMFHDGAEVVKESTAFLLPKDGGPPDVARALGLTDEEYAETQQAERDGRASRFPQARPERCEEWLTGGTGQPEIPAGRQFEKMPRVMRCARSKTGEVNRAVVFIYSSDNPYGNPKGVWKILAGKPDDFIKERFYGFTERTMTARFPKFDLNAHVVKPDQVPKAGTNYHKTDPSSGRNFFMLWFRVTPEATYVYREWPGQYHIPGVGLPGPWALPDGKLQDGRRGPAQDPWGFGNIRYKLELARLEGWRDYERAREKIENEGELSTADRDLISGWEEENGARERIEEREIDSRFASVPKNENDRPSTLLTDFEEIKVWFKPAPAGRISEGIQKINDKLDYDETRPVDFFNKPRLLISSDCHNLIYALRTWTGNDGERGATKDPIEVLYWFFMGENPYLGDAGGMEEKAEDDGRPHTAADLINKLAHGEDEE